MSHSDHLIERRSHLSQTKQALLTKWQRGKLAPINETERIPRRLQQEVAPLSFAQQHIWSLQQEHPQSPAFNFPYSELQISGVLNVKVLDKSLNEVVKRHEILRTTFTEIEGKGVQVIAPFLRVPLLLIDLQRMPHEEQDKEVHMLALAERHQLFDLAHGPLLSITLIRCAEQGHILILNVHLLVGDGWSRGIFFREVTELYRAFMRGETALLAELPIQYADYAVWQRQQLQGEALQTHLAYWKRLLQNVPTILALPTDYPRPTTRTFHGRTHFFTLPSALSQAITIISRRNDVTVFMTLLAAWKTLLYRITGQQDFLIGFPIANRNREEIEKLIGFFIDTLIIRAEFSDVLTFQKILQDTRKKILEAFAHQIIPFEKILEEVSWIREPAYPPFIQVMFNMHNVSLPTLALDTLKISPLPMLSDVIQYDLSLSISIIDAENEMNCYLSYNTDLFQDDTIVCMRENWQILLEEITGLHQPCNVVF